MTEREYPRWVHAKGRPSIVAETAEDEDAFLAAAEPLPLTPLALPEAPQRYRIDGARLDGVEADPTGNWVRWADVAFLFGTNMLTSPSATIRVDTLAVEAEPFGNAPGVEYVPQEPDVAPKRTGGWPKGKPRSNKASAVN